MYIVSRTRNQVQCPLTVELQHHPTKVQEDQCPVVDGSGECWSESACRCAVRCGRGRCCDRSQGSQCGVSLYGNANVVDLGGVALLWDCVWWWVGWKEIHWSWG